MNNKVVFLNLIWRFGEQIGAQLVSFIVTVLYYIWRVSWKTAPNNIIQCSFYAFCSHSLLLGKTIYFKNNGDFAKSFLRNGCEFCKIEDIPSLNYEQFISKKARN